MGKLIYDISMSLDGFITAANPRREAGLGDGGERLHDWGYNTTDPRNLALLGAVSDIGAVITGRQTYDVSIRHWGADGPMGAARATTVILSHGVPADVPANGVYVFADNVAAAYAQAQQAAGGRNIIVQGANAAQQFLNRGLVDELFLHVAPVLFGSGLRLFEQPGGEHITLEIVETIQTAEAVHLRYRVVK